jgi:ornithine cyclodeaminase/alanine dehydrogenase-like protein (mu-crystallin family)
MIQHTQTPTDSLVLTRRDVRRLLGIHECIGVVENAFRLDAKGGTIPPGVLGVHVDNGGFHIKTAGFRLAPGDGYQAFAAKVNANFPENPALHALPTIQGVIALFDSRTGRPLALLDSIEITSLRTAAATAVAAKYLARTEASTVTICGCGEQGRSQLRALACVRPLRTVHAFDADRARGEQYASEMTDELGLDVQCVPELSERTHASDIWVTCTTAHGWFVGREHVAPGAFVAAVGADHPEKQEIEPELLAASTLVVDVLQQCAAMGELHHALDAQVMRVDDVHAELAEVVSGRRPGRQHPDEIIVFDSTGTALEDVAAAALVYERALATGAGVPIDLGGVGP